MYYFGDTSQANMDKVHHSLILVAGVALLRCPQDFMFFDGKRTIQEQEEFVRTGVSHTMKSAHLIQDDGYAWAMDLVPIIGGQPRWELGASIDVARSVYNAADLHRVGLRWGGVWDRAFHELDPNDLLGEVHKYMERRRKAGKGVFIDAPHFQRIEF